jgi:hypothetical protein
LCTHCLCENEEPNGLLITIIYTKFQVYT